MNGQVLLDLVGQPVEDLVLVHGAVRPAFTGRAVVRDEHDQRVVELAGLLEVVEQPPDLVVGVAEEAGVDLRHAAEQPLLVVGERVPGPDGVELGPGLAVGALLVDVRVDRRQLRLVGDHAHLLLPREHELAVRLVPHVEAPLVLVDPLLGGVVRGMAGARAVVEEERLVGRDGLRVTDELERLVGDVRAEVVALLRWLRLVDGVVVVDEVGIPLVRLRPEEPVEALEAAAERPLRLPRGKGHLIGGRQVPLADGVGVPAALAEHLGDGRALERNVAVHARVAVGCLGDAGHPVRRVVPAGHQARAGRRAERRRVEVRVREAALGDPVDVRRLDQPAERLHRRVADVVEDDVEHVRRPSGRDRLRVRLPVRDRVPDVDVDRPFEGLAHLTGPPR